MEKRNKQSAKGKTHDAKLVDALKSLYPSSTQITSILPVQTRFEVAGTSEAARSKGTKSSSTSQLPQKLLLTLTDPGKTPAAPNAPAAVANPYINVDSKIKQVTSDRASAVKAGQDPRPYDKQLSTLAADRDSIQSSKAGLLYSRYLSDVGLYNTALNTYNRTTLPTYNAAKANFDAGTATNTARTTQYEKDLANFFSSPRGGKTGSKRRASVRKGSRSSGSGSSGRSGRSGSR